MATYAQSGSNHTLIVHKYCLVCSEAIKIYNKN